MPRAGNGRGLLRTVDLDAEEIYRSMPRAEKRCRARGGHHRFARDTVLPGDPWPDSVLAWPDNEGRIRIEDPCVDCRLVWRIVRTHPGGALDAFAPSRLVYDEDWVRVPQGMDRRPRMIRQHSFDSARKKNQESVQAALDRAVQRGADPQVPHPRFQSAGA